MLTLHVAINNEPVFNETTIPNEEYFDCHVNFEANPFTSTQIQSLKMFELAKRRGFSIEDTNEVLQIVNEHIENIKKEANSKT